MMNKIFKLALIGIFLLSATVYAADAEKTESPKQVLFKNVHVWDGTSDGITKKINVLIEGNLIKKVRAVESDTNDDALVIDGEGKILMPGLADQHIHFSIYNPLNLGERLHMTEAHMGAVAILRAKRMLMNGYTTVRDMGGPAKFVQQIVDSGLAAGPRVYPSEALLSVTSGHVDMRNRNDPHPNMSNRGSYNWLENSVNSLSYIVDGDTEIRRAVRENFRRGATQIKYTGTGGVTSPSDPLHSVQFTPHEIQIMVEATNDWGTYVAAHVFNEDGIMRAIDNGVQVLEHIPFLTDKAAKMMIEKQIMFATAVAPVFAVEVETARTMYNPKSFEKWYTVRKAAKNMMKVIQDNPEMLKLMTLGTDLVNEWEKTLKQEMKMNLEFKYLAEYFEPVDILRIATSNAARMNRLTGKNNPYQDGPLGVVENGAYADLLLIDGNPLEDIMLLTDPNKNMVLIMKDGLIFKNTLLHGILTADQHDKIEEVLPYMYGDYINPTR